MVLLYIPSFDCVATAQGTMQSFSASASWIMVAFCLDFLAFVLLSRLATTQRFGKLILKCNRLKKTFETFLKFEITPQKFVLFIVVKQYLKVFVCVNATK